jgi:predicted amidohydrolase YtcJ
MRKPCLLAGLFALALIGATPPTPEPADAVYRSGKIWTVDPAHSWAQAVAIAGGRFVAVGSDAEIAPYVGPKTRVVDLAGRMAMPGIHDMHEHPVEGGFQKLVECSFPFTTPLDAIVEKVRECAAKTPKGEWIRGGQWAAETLESAKPPTRAMLDAAAPDNPVFLIDSTFHNAWVNSAALAKLGIDAVTPDPSGGVIVRDASRAPTGILFDNACYGAMKRLPVRSDAQYQEAIRWAVAQVNALGVTTMKDALADGHAVKAYAALDRAGKLDLRVATSRPWHATWTESDADESYNLEHWRDDQTPHVRTGFAKIFVDGIPPTRTAAMLEPYVPDGKHPAGFKGELQHSPADLDAALIGLDKLGLTVKMHATGDRAERVALDAIAAARKANGDSGLRHEIAHAELVTPTDIPRLVKLHAIAELSPILWYPTPLVAVMADVIGRERANRFWPIKSMLDAGVLMVAGSDWPSVVPSPSPWPGIEAMVTRKDPYGVAPGALAPEQAIPLADALAIYTRNGAVAMGLEKEEGTIERGKLADLIVLDRNLFEIPPEQISDTKVLETVFEGRVVFSRPPE